MAIYKFLAFVGLYLVTQSFCTVFCAAAVEDSNRFVDSLIRSSDGPNGTSHLSSMEPFHLNGFQSDFTTKVLLMNTHGHVEYKRGELYGIGNIRRKGNCSLPVYNSKGDKVRLNCTLVFDKLRLVYRGDMKVGVTPTVEIKVKSNVSSLTVGLELKQYINKPYAKPKLDDFEVDDDSINIRSEFRGLGPANSQLHVLQSDFEKHLKKDLEHFIENGLAPLFQCFLVTAGPLPKP